MEFVFSVRSKDGRARGQLTAEFLLVVLVAVAFAVIVISVARSVVVSPASNQTSLTTNTSLCLTGELACNRTCVDACSGSTRLFDNVCECGVCVHRQSQVCPSSCAYGSCS